MKHIFRKTISLFLALTLLSSLSLPAFASEALGEDLKQQETLLNRETQLSTNVFWSTAYSELRTEHFITYTPNSKVKPIVLSGEVLRDQSTVSDAAKRIEAAGYRVVAGINGDFYNTTTGLPIGLVVSDGLLRSSDSGYYAVGFRADGSAVLGKPGVKIAADLGYGVDDGWGTYTPVIRNVAGVNKVRVSEGGIFLYTHDFNAKHTTGTTEPGVDVVCSIMDGEFSIGDTVTLFVEQVLDGGYATPVGEDQIVLSVNLKSDSYYVEALRNVSVGTELKLDITAADPAWNDVEYAVGALYSLVEDGVVASGLEAGMNPRTAVGQKADGTLVFYTIDGRRSGHSIGASLKQVGERLIELGCITAVCLDGGGSTTLSVTKPDALTATVVNTPSGTERAVTNQIFLVAEKRASGSLSHFYVEPEATHVLAGTKVNISASAVDTNYIPMAYRPTLSTSVGTLRNGVLATPVEGGEITVTASGNGMSGSAVVYAIAQPDAVAIRSNGTILSSLTLKPGTEIDLTASAAWNHLSLKADPELFRWSVSGEIGTIDQAGKFVAGSPGSGAITVTAGGTSASIDVTIARVPLQTVEHFETEENSFLYGYGTGMEYSHNTAGETVRIGRGAARLDYVLKDENLFDSAWRGIMPVAVDNRIYNALNLWVCGDGSGNQLYLICGEEEEEINLPIATLDFVGWRQISVPTTRFDISGVGVRTDIIAMFENENGELVFEFEGTSGNGTVYLDQLTATFLGTVDNEVPVVAAELDTESWAIKAQISDEVDGLLKQQAITVTYNGEAVEFEYDPTAGTVIWYLPGPGESYEAMRVTVTAMDASGNIGRASVDVEALGVDHKFGDIEGYWGATYVDFLYNAGITTGYADGTFRPNQNITRAQFAVMLYRYLGLDESLYAEVELPFADLDKIGEYAIPAIKALYTEGVINGSTGADGKLYFNPNNALTRAQAATMIGRTQAKGYASVDLSFTDASKIPSYAQFYIRTMAAQGIISGYADGTFRPNSNITRGQMAKILYNLM